MTTGRFQMSTRQSPPSLVIAGRAARSGREARKVAEFGPRRAEAGFSEAGSRARQLPRGPATIFGAGFGAALRADQVGCRRKGLLRVMGVPRPTGPRSPGEND